MSEYSEVTTTPVGLASFRCLMDESRGQGLTGIAEGSFLSSVIDVMSKRIVRLG